MNATAPSRGSRWNARLAGLADQVFSSLANVLAVVLVAQSTSEGAFGRFALMYAILILLVAVSRSYFGVRISLAESEEAARVVTRRVLGALTWFALPIAAAALAVGIVVVPGQVDAMVLIVAIACPVVCLQDAVRFGSVACGRPHAALFSDVSWTAVIVAAFFYPRSLDASLVMMIWGGAAAAALVLGVLTMRVTPDLRGGQHELRSRHPVGESRAFGAAVTFGSSLIVVTAAAYVISDAAAGALRGASTLVGPVTVLLAYLHLVLTPVLVRRDRSRDIRACLVIAGCMVGLIAAWGAVLLAAPDEWGRLALGDTWTGARTVLPFTVTEFVFVGITTSAVLGLTVRHAAARLFQLKLVASLTTITVGVSAVFVWQRVEVAAASFALTALLSSGIGWWHLSRSESNSLESQAMSN